MPPLYQAHADRQTSATADDFRLWANFDLRLRSIHQATSAIFLTDAYRCNFAFVSVTALIAASRDERPACINSPAVCAVETLFSRKDYLE